MNIIHKKSDNYDSRGKDWPSLVVLHYTGMQTAQQALERLCDPASKVSAHYTIDEGGVIYQHVDEGARAWHAGLSYWRGETDINAHSIGIELVNPGHEFGYRDFPESQIASLLILLKNIRQRHDIKWFLGHSDIAPGRKQDPGHLFPWEKLSRQGFGIWPEEAAPEIPVMQALQEIGYNPEIEQKVLIEAFQSHFVPEAFAQEKSGIIDQLTEKRLAGLHKALSL